MPYFVLLLFFHPITYVLWALWTNCECCEYLQFAIWNSRETISTKTQINVISDVRFMIFMSLSNPSQQHYITSITRPSINNIAVLIFTDKLRCAVVHFFPFLLVGTWYIYLYMNYSACIYSNFSRKYGFWLIDDRIHN